MIDCAAVDRWARELARSERGLAVTGDMDLDEEVALAHVAGCAGCAARMERERRLDGALAGVARDHADVAAPPGLEDALRASFRARRAAPAAGGARAGGGRRWLWGGAGAVGAALAGAAVAAGFALWPAPPPPAQVLVVRAPAVEMVLGQAAGAGGFLPIGTLDWTEHVEAAQVVRMQVPAHLPVMFGWPLPPEDDRPRTADVLVGADGVARGIRFVPVSFRAGR